MRTCLLCTALADPDGALPTAAALRDAYAAAVLARCGGNKRRAADVLGVSLKTLYNWLAAAEARAPAPAPAPASTRRSA